MSILEKIAVGIKNRRSGNNLNFDCSTTANIGVVQPTMAKEMVPDETLHVSVASVCRLLALQNPTFGRMSLRHYHTFVPYNRLWRPFDAMLANKPFRADLGYGDGTLAYFNSTPYFWSDIIAVLVKMYSDVSVYYKSDWNNAIRPGAHIGDINFPSDLTQFIDTINNVVPLHSYFYDLKINSNLSLDAARYFNILPYSEGFGRGLGYNELGVINFGEYYLAYPQTSSSSAVMPNVTVNPSNFMQGNLRPSPAGTTVISKENADLIVQYGDFVYMFKYKPILKKVRQIFIGLGYQFNPFLPRDVVFNPFKLYAYYISMFELFNPKREINLQQTACYELTQLSDSYAINLDDDDYYVSLFRDFILKNLLPSTYYLPMDYFSASTHLAELEQNNFGVSTVLNSTNPPVTQQVMQQTTGGIPTPAGNVNNPLVIKLAQTLWKYSNKNTVIGRSVRDYLHVHFGITDVSDDNSSPLRIIGSSRVNLDIHPLLSMSDTVDGEKGSALGSLAGSGEGSSKSETFDFKADTFGVWLTLTVVVPESGMYQGYLRENRHIQRNDFFNRDFDALGYQVVERGEVSSDYTAKGDYFDPSTAIQYNTGFGLLPRYSEYKTSQNIVNGDLSLRGLRNSMSSFTLDRRFPTENLKPMSENSYDVISPSYVPRLVFDGFRAIDQADIVGDYNRIFTYMGNDFDHFIIHNVFNVRAVAPWKPLSSSFDTFDDDDDTSIKVHKA